MISRIICLSSVLILNIVVRCTNAAVDDRLNVLDFGAKADNQTDNTEAFQNALDAAAKLPGGEVYAPAGIYRFSGHLKS